jgi:hypothetical protein
MIYVRFMESMPDIHIFVPPEYHAQEAYLLIYFNVIPRFYVFMCFFSVASPLIRKGDIPSDHLSHVSESTGETVIHKWNGRNLEHFQSLNNVLSVPAIPGAWNRFWQYFAY